MAFIERRRSLRGNVNDLRGSAESARSIFYLFSVVLLRVRVFFASLLCC